MKIIPQNITGYPSVDKTHKRKEKFMERHPLIPNISVYKALCMLSISHKNDIAVNCHSLTITFEELKNDAIVISNAFRALGIESGGIIVVCMPNLYQAISIFLAANRIGATVTFLNEFATADEIRHYLDRFQARLFICYNYDERYHDILFRAKCLRHIITINKSEAESHLASFSIPAFAEIPRFLQYKHLKYLAGMRPGNQHKIFSGGKQNALILFTSGTTGEPKAVVLTNRNILAAAIYLKNSSHISSAQGEKCLACVPFTYPYGFCTSVLMSLLCNREVILAPKLSLDSIGYYLEKHPHIVFGSPALLELIMRGCPQKLNLSSIKIFISGGDFLTSVQEDAAKEFFSQHGGKVLICNGSGNAETVSCGTNQVGIELRSGTVGRILTGTEVIIVNPDTYQEIKYGEEGLLCVSGKHVFKEYYLEPDLTSKAKMRYKGKTYFITGTMGILDEDGYFTLTGRQTRFYITSSLNKIYCDHVQNFISSIDVVSTCAVVKKPNVEKLFTNKAFVILKPNVAPTEKTLKYIAEKCKQPIMLSETNVTIQLKSYEIPEEIEFVKQLPRTKADKIDYHALEEMAKEM